MRQAEILSGGDMRSRTTVLVTVFLTSCTPSMTPPTPTSPADAHFTQAPADVWRALTIVYTDLGIPIDNMDRDSWFLRSGVITSLPSTENGIAFDCGTTRGHKRPGKRAPTIDVATALEIKANLTTLLIPKDGGMDVRNRINAMGDAPGMGRHICYSTGLTESRVVEALRARM